MKYIILSLIIFTFAACGDAAKTLRNEKTKTTDEFLVKKRQPLVLPPDYNKLPEPKSNEKKVSKDEDIKSILKTPQKKKSENTSSSIEQKILNKIRK